MYDRIFTTNNTNILQTTSLSFHYIVFPVAQGMRQEPMETAANRDLILLSKEHEGKLHRQSKNHAAFWCLPCTPSLNYTSDSSVINDFSSLGPWLTCFSLKSLSLLSNFDFYLCRFSHSNIPAQPSQLSDSKLQLITISLPKQPHFFNSKLVILAGWPRSDSALQANHSIPLLKTTTTQKLHSKIMPIIKAK